MNGRALLPTGLLRLGNRVIRPRDLAELYHNPRAELRRLARTGVVRHVAHGYFVLVPPESFGNEGWRPLVEDLALAVGVADYGDRTALMGLSAARYHGAAPRSHATAWVATNVIRRPLEAGRFGRVFFVRRNVAALDTVRAHTSLVDGWVTSIEQTIVDLARRPDYAGGEDVAWEALTALWPRANEQLLADLAGAQRGRAGLERVRRALRGMTQ